MDFENWNVDYSYKDLIGSLITCKVIKSMLKTYRCVGQCNILIVMHVACKTVSTTLRCTTVSVHQTTFGN